MSADPFEVWKRSATVAATPRSVEAARPDHRSLRSACSAKVHAPRTESPVPKSSHCSPPSTSCMKDGGRGCTVRASAGRNALPLIRGPTKRVHGQIVNSPRTIWRAALALPVRLPSGSPARGRNRELPRGLLRACAPRPLPALHLRDLTLLVSDDVARKLLKLGTPGRLEELATHGDRALMVWDHHLDER